MKEKKEEQLNSQEYFNVSSENGVAIGKIQTLKTKNISGKNNYINLVTSNKFAIISVTVAIISLIWAIISHFL